MARQRPSVSAPASSAAEPGMGELLPVATLRQSTSMRASAEIMADIILEEQAQHDFEIDAIAGVMANGVPLGTLLSDILEVDFAIVRPSREDTAIDFASNYAGFDGKQVIIVDDVVGTGSTSREVIEFVKQEGGKPVLVMVLINKRAENDLDGVPLRALVRARPVGA